MSDTVLSVENVGKAYRSYHSNLARFANWFGAPVRPSAEFWAVRGLTFGLKHGEALALIGRNGAGKSTLLKIITGTVRPTTGRVAVAGRISAILELGIGFNPELTGRQNVFHAGGLMGYSREHLAKLMPSIEAFADLGGFFDEPLRVYSSGMHARLAFSLATAERPDVLIVDEVLSVGDALFQAKCFQRIAQYQQEGTALLLVTHSLGDVVRHAERAILLDHGKVAFHGSSREACNVYLDSLFGKQRASEPGELAPTLAPESVPDLAQSEDVFHTRPGYRKEEHRWGHGGARILDFLVRSQGSDYPALISSNAPAQLSFSVYFDHDFEDVTPGMLIKSLDGFFIYGTNSVLAGGEQRLLSVKANESRVFTFSLPMDLNAGHYLLSFGVSTGMDGSYPLDRRYDAILLTVERPVPFWGMFDMRAEFRTDVGA